MENITCSDCGLARQSELSSTSIRPPCERCGSNAIIINLAVEEMISISSQCVAELIPGKQNRDWKQRWELLENDFEEIAAPRFNPMNRYAIHIAYQRLCSFYIHAYHLKDALKFASSELGLSKSVIEYEIKNDPRLAILADLANLDKHSQLTNKPRSGAIPDCKISGIDNSVGNGWSLSGKINHDADLKDGIIVARDALTAWHEKLSMWGLI